MDLPLDPSEVAHQLLGWYGREGRDLPWRQTRDPYRIWLSEIMLQQTTVVAVIPYYERFLTAFPTVASLAAASLDEVLALWAGLGYYSRARNLHRTARLVVETGGVFPDTLEGLMALPGVGRSTAGAILSIAYDQPAPILDGNVRRVLVRLMAWREDPRSREAEKQLWRWAEALTSRDRPHDYAQAIMDLGATVCTPQEPDCAACPLASCCVAHALGMARTLPIRRKKPPVPVRSEVTLLLQHGDALLVRQRPAEGLLGGLWEFPVVDHAAAEPVRSVAEALLTSLGRGDELKEVGALPHAYSHFKLVSTVYAAVCTERRVAEKTGYVWRSRQALQALPLHGAHRKVLELFLQKDS